MVLHFLIRGRVQGVGFRWFVHREASELDLHGWVRNTEDGDVEVVASGSVDDLADLRSSLRRGPRGARVDQVIEHYLDEKEAAGLSSFPGKALQRKKLLNKACRAGAIGHHQQLDLDRHPEKATPTTKKLRAKDRPLENDYVSDEEFDRLLHACFGNVARVLRPGRAFYIWGGYANVANYPPALKAAGLKFSQAIIWNKLHPVLTRKDFMGAHEWCFYGWREGAGHRFFGPANATDLWEIKKVNPQSMVHLTEKPVELAGRALRYSSQPGENVLDLFGGSGSTLIAAEQAGRKAFLMELDPLYCDVIVQRFEQFTGTKAERVPGGTP